MPTSSRKPELTTPALWSYPSSLLCRFELKRATAAVSSWRNLFLFDVLEGIDLGSTGCITRTATLTVQILILIRDQPGITYSTIEELMNASNASPSDVFAAVRTLQKDSLIGSRKIENGYYLTAFGMAYLFESNRSSGVDEAFDRRLVIVGVCLLVAIAALLLSTSSH